MKKGIFVVGIVIITGLRIRVDFIRIRIRPSRTNQTGKVNKFYILMMDYNLGQYILREKGDFSGF